MGFVVSLRSPAFAAGVPTVPVGAGSFDVAIDTSTDTIYVTGGFGADSVSVLDGATCDASTESNCTPVANPTVGSSPTGVAVDNDTNTIYVANFYSNTVSVINGANCDSSNQSNCAPVGTASVGADPGGIAIDPVTNTVYVANQSSNTVSVIDGATCDATNQSNCTPLASPSVWPDPYNITVNPNTNTVYVTNLAYASVSVIDGATCDGANQTNCTMAATIPVGFTPEDVTVDATTDTVYVTSEEANLGNGVGGQPIVSIIDGATCDGTDQSNCSPLANPALASSPYGVAVDVGTNSVYVSDSSGVSVIDGATCDATVQSGCAATIDGITGSTAGYLGLVPSTANSPDTIYVASGSGLTIFGQPSAPIDVTATSAGPVR